MQVIGKLLLQDFWKEHPEAKKPLEKWTHVVEGAEWKNWSELKMTFRSADLVRSNQRKFVVFNIGGNKYRLITTVNFKGQIVVINVALTHKDYDKGKWKH